MNSLGSPASILTDAHRFSSILDLLRQLFNIFSAFIQIWTPFSEQMCPKYSTCPQKMASRNSSGDSADSGDSPEMVLTKPVRPLGSTRAGRKDDGNLHKLPQMTCFQITSCATTDAKLWPWTSMVVPITTCLSDKCRMCMLKQRTSKDKICIITPYALPQTYNHPFQQRQYLFKHLATLTRNLMQWT